MKEERGLLQDSSLEAVNGGARRIKKVTPKLRNCSCPRCGSFVQGHTTLTLEPGYYEQIFMCHNCGINWIASTNAKEYTLVSTQANEKGRFAILGPYQK